MSPVPRPHVAPGSPTRSAGVWVSFARAEGGFTAPALKVRNFGTAQGWRADRYPSRTADLNNGGRPDIVGFGHSATWVTVC